MKLLTPKQVAERLNVSKSFPYALVDRGAIPAYRIGGAIRIDEADLDKYLESRKMKPLNRIKNKP